MKIRGCHEMPVGRRRDHNLPVECPEQPDGPSYLCHLLEVYHLSAVIFLKALETG